MFHPKCGPIGMKYDSELRTSDCDPTLNDSQVLEFCREGYLILPCVVPDEFTRLTCDYLEEKSYL